MNDDTIIGAGGNDQLEGGGGNDFLNSGAGTDVLDGGAGTDFLDLRGQAQQTVDLATGTTSDGDTLRGIEGVIGSEGNDTITGQADGVSYLAGGAGDDVLSAPRGSDGITVVWGGAGADTITVGARNAGVLAVQVDGLTEETFRDFRLEDVNVGAGFDWGAIDLVVLNPDATDSYRYEDVIPPSYPGDTPRYLDGDLFREQNTGRGSIEYSQDEMYFTNYDEFETRPDDLELSYDPADAYVAPNLAYDGQRVFDATFLGGSVDAVFTTLSFSQRIVTNYVAREGGARKDYDRDAGELIGEGTTPSSLIPGLGAPDHTFAVESFVSQYGEDPDITETVEVWRVLWNPGEEDQGEYLLPGEVPGLVIDETPSRAFVAGGTVSFDGSGRGSITVDGANIITATLPERQEGTEADEAFLGTAGRDFVFAGGGTDSFATDGSIFGATSGGAGSGRTFTLASGDRLSSVELVSGLDGTASIRQDTGEAAWDAIYDATTTGGERERSVFYDDGRTRIEEYGTDGVIDQAKTTFEDGTIRVETFDTDGVIDGRTDTATDGIMTTTAFTGGLRTTLTRTDPANAQAWSEIIQTFAEDGTTLTRRRDAYDDGRVYETSYLDGIRTTRTGEDVQDAFVWSEIVQTFSADGMVVTGRTVTYDDGRVLVADNGSDGVIDLAVVTHGNGRVDTTTYANGLRAERLSEDLGDAFAWSTIRQTWEGDGTTLAERVVTYDDGRIATTPYDNGVAGEVIWTDPGMI